MIVNKRKFNPAGFQLFRYVLNPGIRTIVLYGGSSSGKSYSVAQVILTLAIFRGENTLVMRKVGASISKSIYEDFKMACHQLGYWKEFKFTDSTKRIVCHRTGARIDFSGLDDPEKIKGISNYMRVVLDEWSEFDLADYKQIRKRLRGKKGQQIITAFNPISEDHWIKRNVIDVEQWHDVSMNVWLSGEKVPDRLTHVKSIRMNAPKPMMNARTGEIYEHEPDMVLIQSTYLNNFWVVGSPCGTYGYYDEQCIADFEKDRINDPDYYNVYALGEWGVVRTGCEFFGSFNRGRHCASVKYDPSLPIHISVDNNRLPYISYTFWQADHSEGIHLRQIHEICATAPDNSARKSAFLVARYLREIGYFEKLYLHGDCTTRNGNTIDDEGRTFLDKVISTLTEEGYEVEDKVGTSNPSVPMSGEFINTIWEGGFPELAITIGEDCKTSISDYMSVQKDSNGAIYKKKVKDKVTMQTYEQHGHLTDTMRYVVVDIMNAAFLDFSNRRKRNLYARNGLIHYYNPATECKYNAALVYCIPNAAGKFVMVHGKRCGQTWHIVDVAFFETSSTEEIKERLNAAGCSPAYIEAGRAYFPFIRELRREAGYTVKVVPADTDIDRRIAATSDYVKSSILFSETRSQQSAEYAAFVAALLDYNTESRRKEASAAMSGFAKVAAKMA